MIYLSAPYVLLNKIAAEAGEVGVWDADGWFEAIGNPAPWIKDWALDFAFVKTFEWRYPTLPLEAWPDVMADIRERTYNYDLFVAVRLMRHKRSYYPPSPRLDDCYPPGSLPSLAVDFEDFLDF